MGHIILSITPISTIYIQYPLLFLWNFSKGSLSKPYTSFLDSRELDLVKAFNDGIEKSLSDLIKNHYP